jgi:hypothetical protein
VTVLTQRPVLVLVLGAVLGLSACGGDDEGSDGTFDRDEFPFTFEYPESFEESEDVTLDVSLGSQADATAAVGLDEDNAILVERFTLNRAVDESNLDVAKREIDALLKQVDPAATSEETEVAGLPALTFESLEIPSVEEGESRLAIVFDGDQEYYLNCQSTPAERAQVDEACDLALESFALK